MLIGYVGSKHNMAHYIGRGGKGQKQSALANPFALKLGREQCVRLFRFYMFKIIVENMEPDEALSHMVVDPVHNYKLPTRAEIIAELSQLKANSFLECFCYKKPVESGGYHWHCHGEVVAKLYDYCVKEFIFASF